MRSRVAGSVRAAVIIFLVYALIVNAGTFLVLAPAFLGTPSDYVAALLASFGATVAASSVTSVTSKYIQGGKPT